MEIQDPNLQNVTTTGGMPIVVPNQQHVCPNCGYCPHCGQRRHYPYYPSYPYYWAETPMTYTGIASNVGNRTIFS